MVHTNYSNSSDLLHYASYLNINMQYFFKNTYVSDLHRVSELLIFHKLDTVFTQSSQVNEGRYLD